MNSGPQALFDLWRQGICPPWAYAVRDSRGKSIGQALRDHRVQQRLGLLGFHVDKPPSCKPPGKQKVTDQVHVLVCHRVSNPLFPAIHGPDIQHYGLRTETEPKYTVHLVDQHPAFSIPGKQEHA